MHLILFIYFPTQGGPGASGVGLGNFGELGPYSIEDQMKKRQFAWVSAAEKSFRIRIKKKFRIFFLQRNHTAVHTRRKIFSKSY